MDYQQSLKNFYHLKNFVRAWTECHIFFFFYSDTEYEIEIFGCDFTPEQQKKIDDQRRSEFPYSFINNEKNGEEVLYYSDSNISVEYNLFSGIADDFICHDSVDKKILQKQFSLLIQKLKNV